MCYQILEIEAAVTGDTLNAIPTDVIINFTKSYLCGLVLNEIEM
jgi:hypothetical protein